MSRNVRYAFCIAGCTVTSFDRSLFLRDLRFCYDHFRPQLGVFLQVRRFTVRQSPEGGSLARSTLTPRALPLLWTGSTANEGSKQLKVRPFYPQGQGGPGPLRRSCGQGPQPSFGPMPQRSPVSQETLGTTGRGTPDSPQTLPWPRAPFQYLHGPTLSHHPHFPPKPHTVRLDHGLHFDADDAGDDVVVDDDVGPYSMNVRIDYYFDSVSSLRPPVSFALSPDHRDKSSDTSTVRKCSSTTTMLKAVLRVPNPNLVDNDGVVDDADVDDGHRRV